MSVEAPNFNQYDPSMFKPEFADGAIVPASARDMLDSQRAQFVLTNGALSEAVEVDPAVNVADKLGRGDKIGHIIIGGLVGSTQDMSNNFAIGTDNTLREFFGAKPTPNPSIGRSVGAYALAA